MTMTTARHVPQPLDEVLDLIEAEAWKVAAEPIPARMDDLRDHVRTALVKVAVHQADTVRFASRAHEVIPRPEPDNNVTIAQEESPAKPRLRIARAVPEPEAAPQAAAAASSGAQHDSSTADTSFAGIFKTKLCKSHPGGPKILPVSEFCKDGTKKGDGLRFRCRGCERDARAALRERKAAAKASA